jgi:hypothetical protein
MLDEEALLIFHLRPARRKARAAAIAEALGLLEDLRGFAPVGGPLSEQGGLFWIALRRDSLESAVPRFPRLGYTRAVDLLKPPAESERSGARAADPQARLVRWRRTLYHLVRVYEEDAQAMRDAAVDRRTFLFETSGGEIRPVRGYRGDSHPLSRRGLPVCDARLLVNLVSARAGTLLLDPFAGAGGIVIEALSIGAAVVSADVDPSLRHGLTHLGARHHVADARHLPVASETFEAIATEPPYHTVAQSLVCEALREMDRVLKHTGRVAMLCAAPQADAMRGEAAALGWRSTLDTPINRKGLDTVALAWRKGEQG